MVDVFDDTQCSLGEGPLWHPERKQFFWFDINAHRLYSRTDAGRQVWQFDAPVSAAGWVDRDRLLIASDTELFLFNVEDGGRTYTLRVDATGQEEHRVIL
ncbi:SMP-30/gluconolactonase/LRE family protein [Actibacterium pelagium]|uniref:SMP-30/Gluconolactonase/LRE-like region domain-containing protein n=1 Tax=Actibacterium pelagium TaxID=2029103 RepID=A0A917EKU4_9RHOB|nr:SMP-30/gluconolactonase/LRE family protein [Actibacterium pelagium]GGE58216.1 hypothetical protein GCM10011517_27380 [Actibacterium pelagium]